MSPHSSQCWAWPSAVWRRHRRSQADGDPASDVGITAKEIRIAVVADVDNSFRPGLFAASPAAVQAFAKYINKSGGLAGRKLVVDFIDSHMSPDDARGAIQQACEEDFALVGTGALFLNSVEDMVNCADKAGEATGIPDIPIVTTEIAQQCSPVSFPINAPQLICGTQDQIPQTFQGNVGGFFYYQKHRNADLHGINVYVNDLKSSAAAAKVLGGSAEAEGIEIEQIGMSALATQTEFTPLIQRAEQADANFIANAGAYQTSVKMRREAKLQGLDVDNIVWDCASNCYDEKLIQEGGSDVEGQYARIYQLPFTEAKHSPALRGVPQEHPEGQDRWLRRLRLGRRSPLPRRREHRRPRARRKRDHAQGSARSTQRHPRVRRRQHVGYGRHRQPRVQSLLRAHAGAEREVRSRAPEEARNVRLQGEEHDHLQGGLPQRLTGVTRKIQIGEPDPGRGGARRAARRNDRLLRRALRLQRRGAPEQLRRLPGARHDHRPGPAARLAAPRHAGPGRRRTLRRRGGARLVLVALTEFLAP